MLYADESSSPATWPFAVIPVVPNFPLFYVLWRAWSHYKAWRGALYLESLLKLDMIRETTDPKLDEVYRSSGVVLPAKGQENQAPDATSGSKTGSTGSKTSAFGKAAAPAGGAGKLPLQAKGETTGAADSTSTPKSYIYSASATSFKSSSSSSASSAASSPASGSADPNHPSLLLTPNMVPLLTRAFDLRQVEVMDLNRAVEQADMRARKADKQAEGKDGAGGTQSRGTLRR